MDAFNTPLTKGVDDHLSVGMVAFELMAERYKLFAELQVIVDLAIVGQVKTAISTRHRLGTIFGQIHDGQPPMSKPYVAIMINPQTGTIGTAVTHRIPHLLNKGLRHGRSISN